MTAFRCTGKLLKSLKATVETDTPTPENRLGDWTANVVRYGRKPFVIAVAEHSRIALLLPAAPYATLTERFLEDLPYLLRYLHIPEPLIESEIAAMAPLHIAKSNSRSVLASINGYDQTMAHLLASGENWTTVGLMAFIAEDISKPNDYQPTGDVVRARFGLAPMIGPALREAAEQARSVFWQAANDDD
ncbi:hypothetical protein [Salinisphaera sp. Q1T1-3]|uniref:DUF6933 domain-containing protein n=1 Tax=Salinisphaera sp. Q1T1-3 TaxID=2321229 RepID=UPI0011C35E9C|nr:hypothetical protein [Salinisphaera sp. Q1T1-3]